jgi:hypothetical protein
MGKESGLLIVCLGVGLAAALPVLLYLSLRRQNIQQQVRLMGKALQQTLHPGQPQEEALDELARRVAEFKKELPK